MGIMNDMIKSSVKKTAIRSVSKVATTYIEHEKKTTIKMPYDSSHYSGENYEEVVAFFESLGFVVKTLPHRDLINGWITKDGSVESIMVNGVEGFKKGKKFVLGSLVTIKYHTFRR